MEVTDIYRTFYPKTIKCTFFPRVHGIFSGTNHILGHKTSFNMFKKIKIITCIFYNHNDVKLQTNHKKKTGENANMWRLNNMILNNQWVNEANKKSKKYMETNEDENTMVQNLWDTAKAILSGKYKVIQAYLKR